MLPGYEDIINQYKRRDNSRKSVFDQPKGAVRAMDVEYDDDDEDDPFM